MQLQTRPGTLAALAAAGVVLGAVATSSNPVFVRLSDVPETASAFHRMAWALPAFAVWGLAAGLGVRRTGAGKGNAPPVVAEPGRSRRLFRSTGTPTERRDLLLLVLCGVFFAGDLAALHAAVNLTTAANAILFLNAQPIYVSIGAWLLFGERVGVRFVGAATLAIFGVVVLAWTSVDIGAGHALGDALGIVAGVCYAGYILVASRLRTDYSSLAINVATWSRRCAAASRGGARDRSVDCAAHGRRLAPDDRSRRRGARMRTGADRVGTCAPARRVRVGVAARRTGLRRTARMASARGAARSRPGRGHGAGAGRRATRVAGTRGAPGSRR